MKIRTGFVSNSSSSSFIIVNPKNIDEIKESIDVFKLNSEQILKIKKQILRSLEKEWYSKKDLKKVQNIKETDDVYLTTFISDSLDEHYRIGHKYGIEYQDGDHGRPYSVEWYDCVEDNGSQYDSFYIFKN